MFKNKGFPSETPAEETTTLQPEKKGPHAVSCEPTHISQGTTIKGDIISSVVTTIDGKIEGSVTSQGDVQIGPLADVNGEVEGKNITVAGRLKGRIFADDKVHLLTGAHVHGDIYAQSLKIDDAAVFNGGCNMGEGARKRRTELKNQPPSTVQPVKLAA
jgi:cytoskeletal protein CcmA (bactofilin family)